jgi:hypothetical protein
MRKRRKPSKKERDYKKRMKAEEERKAKYQQRYQGVSRYGNAKGRLGGRAR